MANESLFASSDVWEQRLTAGQAKLVQSIADHWPSDVRTALDVGCGDGKITHALADCTGVQFHGFDGSKEALKRLHVPSTHGDVRELPFADGSFDLVISTDTLEHLSDDIEARALAEMFRVALDWVFIAVPFQEELLEATACCASCGRLYHVNWHCRSYGVDSLSARAPAGWRCAAAILTGESWSAYLSPEIYYRRQILNEWSGWSNSVCPFCGAPGSPPDPVNSLDKRTAAILGSYTYRLLNHRRVNRSHTEILAIFAKTDRHLECRISDRVRTSILPVSMWTSEMGLASDLDPYPQTARMVPATAGGYILQMPIYPDTSKQLKITANRNDKVTISVEDGLGVMLSECLSLSTNSSFTLNLPTRPTPTYHGLLIRISSCESIDSVLLVGECPEVTYLFAPKTGRGYFPIPGGNVLVHTDRTHWLDFPNLAVQEWPEDLSIGVKSLHKITNSAFENTRANLSRLFKMVGEMFSTLRESGS